MKTTLLQLRWLWYGIALVLAGASIVALGTLGLRQGLDFTGGSLMTIRFEQTRPSIEQVQKTLSDTGLELGETVVQPAGEKDVLIRSKTVSDEDHQKIVTALSAAYGENKELRFDAIGPAIGEELRQKSLRGLLIVLVAILAYVAYVFRKVSAPVQSWKYGIVTILASSFVVLIPLGVFAVLGRLYGTEIGTPFVAAILTIIGYSITDTIVVMDRIRENLIKVSGSFAEIVEKSIRQTFVRSITNSMATLLTLVAIFLYGGDTLDEFTLPVIIGIVVGTFASMLLASPLLVTWQSFSARKRS